MQKRSGKQPRHSATRRRGRRGHKHEARWQSSQRPTLCGQEGEPAALGQSAVTAAGEEWVHAGAAWRKARESLGAVQRAQPGARVAELLASAPAGGRGWQSCSPARLQGAEEQMGARGGQKSRRLTGGRNGTGISATSLRLHLGSKDGAGTAPGSSAVHAPCVREHACWPASFWLQPASPSLPSAHPAP